MEILPLQVHGQDGHATTCDDRRSPLQSREVFVKLHARLHRGSEVLEHELELLARGGTDGVRHVRIGDETTEAHYEEITPGVYSLLINGRSYEAYVSKRPGDAPGLSSPYEVVIGMRRYLVELRDPRQWRRRGSSIETEGPQEIVAPMPGKIVKTLVAEGQEVKRNQGLLVIEAMKMQNELRAPRAGRVERVYTAEGQGVEAGTRLLRLA
jgi:biotin carboxyl carrier protein